MSQRSRQVLKHPFAFLLQTINAFRANQGLLLAGAVAYYALLSLLPLIILSVIVLSHLVNQAELVVTLGRSLEWLVPSQSQAIMVELTDFLEHRDVLGWMLTGTMLFFSSLAFSVLEAAMSAIFNHRGAVRQRHFLISALLPYCYVLLVGVGLLVMTLLSGYLQLISAESVHFLGLSWSLGGFSGVLLYLFALLGEILILTSIYRVMPVGHLSLRHALIGGVTATFLWEIIRHVLVWYFSSLSQVGVVYGSLTTAIVVLLSLEIAAGLLLFGAQIISEYEREEFLPDPSPVI